MRYNIPDDLFMERERRREKERCERAKERGRRREKNRREMERREKERRERAAAVAAAMGDFPSTQELEDAGVASGESDTLAPLGWLHAHVSRKTRWVKLILMLQSAVLLAIAARVFGVL